MQGGARLWRLSLLRDEMLLDNMRLVHTTYENQHSILKCHRKSGAFSDRWYIELNREASLHQYDAYTTQPVVGGLCYPYRSAWTESYCECDFGFERKQF